MNTLIVKEPFLLEVGESLPELEISYCTYGKLNEQADNVVWICHALTANADALDWWPGLVGPGKFFDPQSYFIVCANILGSCYGTTGPASIDPRTRTTYGKDFPVVTVRDMVRCHQILAKKLGIRQVELLIGGSMGGQQVLEWAIMAPDFAKRICVLATNARHSAWGIAFNEAQRMAIESDPSWQDRTPGAGKAGLESARAIAMLSYRNYQTYELTQTDKNGELLDDYRASSYQRYQGMKLFNRFDVLSYWYLSKAMDSHHVGRGRGGLEKALSRITARSLVIGIHSDVLFPIGEQATVARGIKGSQLEIIDSFYGHDGFLIESELIAGLLGPFLADEIARNGNKRALEEKMDVIDLNTDAIPGTEGF
ncbi:homoserine O-acetyltransferase MetX [Flavilitoribacter nigricans]|uniref:Homoserine O-acetyltransferase n=1 Tax=Flavilitoribacter nigricans (strain ATCC 23147 / DSM 23189 / NBRC 102662 / NCIMB 1420 / SS-2) TaxID=1122177 RepID=A0A2D0NJR3_FLAN2|nr:homoserine O-acetyltransferase [Flavilitoribacter nigricans]PHN08697.1 homoserine O-acetyltransferase [Flavilitoribacter nigricans DSM 23189 = NBRC 102662]